MAVVQPRVLDRISLALAHLKRSSPKSFEELEQELTNLYGQRVGEAVIAPADKVFVAQGKAQQMHELVDLMTTCIADAQRLEDKLRSATKERT